MGTPFECILGPKNQWWSEWINLGVIFFKKLGEESTWV